jgi:flagellin-like protein
MRKLFDGRKALSPTIAAIILVAVTVAVSVAVASWLSSLTVSFTKVDELTIESYRWASDVSYIDFIVKNTGTESIILSSVEVNKVPAQSVTYLSGKTSIAVGESATVRVSEDFILGANYEFWIITETGSRYPCITAAPTTQLSQVGWWNVNCSFRSIVTVRNDLSSTLRSGYTVLLTMDTSSLIASGKMLPNGNDLRIVYLNGSSFAELDRDIVGINTNSTQIWFKTQDDISASSAVNNYELYYGNPTANNPPENKSNVYLWFDDFNRADEPSITAEAAYSVKTGGGVWSIENGALKNVGDSGDPNKLIITGLGNVNSAVDMLVKIKVSSFSGGDISRMGLSCCMDSSPSRGSGYCALFHEDTNSLDLLNDLRSWGTQSSFGWSLNTWYNMRFRVIDPANRLGQVKVWSVGTPEPNGWTVDGNFGGGSARNFGEVGFAGSRTSDTTYFKDVVIRYVASQEPSVSLGPEEQL